MRILAAALALAAFLSPPLPAAPHVVTDALGRTVAFDAVPSRIVATGRGTILLVDAIYLFPGAGARVLGTGVTDQGLGDVLSVLDPSCAGKRRFANDAGPEQIASVRPDLVILKTYAKQQVGDALERAGITVLYLDLESPEAFYADVRTLGALFGQPGRAEAIVRWYKTRAASVTAKVAGARRPTALTMQAAGLDADFAGTVPPAGWIQARMVETAGGTPVWTAENRSTGWMKVGVEQIAFWDPEYVFVVSYNQAAAGDAKRLAGSPTWQATRAGRTGAIRAFPADLLSWDQSDSRWVLGLEWLAATLHPDRFPGFDLAAEVTAFYREMYGLDLSTIESLILPRLAPAIPSP